MCQANVYLVRDGNSDLIVEEATEIEVTADGVLISTFFEEPKLVHARLFKVDLLKHTVTLLAEE